MKKENIKINEKEALIKIDPKIYPLEVLYGAAYNFLERVYIYFDSNKDQIDLQIKPKKNLSKEELESLVREFLNELITVGLRFQIADKNKKIREYVISAALVGSSDELREEIKNNYEMEGDDNEEWNDDPLGIATPWEEKNNKEK
jgi:His-Xaa-Ser system protein HxsD